MNSPSSVNHDSTLFENKSVSDGPFHDYVKGFHSHGIIHSKNDDEAVKVALEEDEGFSEFSVMILNWKGILMMSLSI